jgi:cell division septal protein FtsQ
VTREPRPGATGPATPAGSRAASARPPADPAALARPPADPAALARASADPAALARASADPAAGLPSRRAGSPARPAGPAASRTTSRSRSTGGPWKAAFFTLTAVTIVVVAVWALLGSSLLVVRSVSVTGSGAVPAAEVIRAAGIAPGTPLARLNTAAVARRVEQITQIQSAQVSRHWPDSVVIAVTDRTPALAVASGGGFALIDKFGVVVRHAARQPPGMVVLSPAPALASLRGSPAVLAAVTVLGELPRQFRSLVRAVTAASPDAVTLHLQGGITVVWGGTGRPAAKAAELQILIGTRATFYDLSDPDTAVTGG